MQYRQMGRTGMRVSELCLGAMTFGREADEAESFRMLDCFAGQGGNFIDIADVYGETPGRSEEVVGKWLKHKRREDWVIATKVRFPMGSGPNDHGLSRKHILEAAASSLRRLGTDAIDLYQVHYWDPLSPLEETLRALDDLVRQGLVRYIGVSNHKGWQLQKAIDISRANGWEWYTCLQPLYNLLDRGVEWELVPICLNEGLGIIPWSPLRGGWLSGKYYRGMQAPPPGTRVEEAEQKSWGERWELYANERTWTVLDALHAVAAAEGHSPAQVALNWLLQQPAVTAPIVGARTLKHLQDNLGAAEFRLAPEHVQQLSEAGKMDAPYPYNIGV